MRGNVEEDDVTDLMKKETHQTRRNDRVVNPQVPSSPLKLQPVELGEIGVGIKESSRLVYGGC